MFPIYPVICILRTEYHIGLFTTRKEIVSGFGRRGRMFIQLDPSQPPEEAKRQEDSSVEQRTLSLGRLRPFFP